MPRIIYNGNNLDVDADSHELLERSIQQRNINRAPNGVEVINNYGYTEIDLYIGFDLDIFRDVYTFWWSWARLGKVFAIAMDSTKTVSTTLDASASAGSTTIPLTSTTGLSVGDECIIESDDGSKREAIKIASISSGVSVEADANLIFSFASGDTFRHHEYYPSMICIDDNWAPVKSGRYYTQKLTMATA